jgi:hypothetical protein
MLLLVGKYHAYQNIRQASALHLDVMERIAYTPNFPGNYKLISTEGYWLIMLGDGAELGSILKKVMKMRMMKKNQIKGKVMKKKRVRKKKMKQMKTMKRKRRVGKRKMQMKKRVRRKKKMMKRRVGKRKIQMQRRGRCTAYKKSYDSFSSSSSSTATEKNEIQDTSPATSQQLQKKKPINHCTKRSPTHLLQQ